MNDKFIQMAYQLPMIECSSCGQVVGHLYGDFYSLTKQLMEELEGTDIPSGSYQTKSGDDIRPFLRTYYSWYSEAKEQPDPPLEYLPNNVVARALLRTAELNTEDLPFGSKRETDGTLSFDEPRICCIRMLITDPGTTPI